MAELRYLLLQIRNTSDPMRLQEVDRFAKILRCDQGALEVFDLLKGAPSRDLLQSTDMILLGGSGHYSAAGEGEWLEQAMDGMREIHRLAKPTFASCWGFQAMARALGGRCVNDLPNAELGTIELKLTEAGQKDPLFCQLPTTFTAQAGHEDHVIKLPQDAELLASSNQVQNQAFRFIDKPIYCTQFHPELDRTSFLERVRVYPEYIEKIVGIPYEQFEKNCYETPEANSLLQRFVEQVFG